MNSIDFGSVGILQIGNARYGFRPMEVYSEFGHAPIMKGEFLPDVFETSNRMIKTKTHFSVDLATPSIKDVIFNDPATIVIWSDGSKTVVKCQSGDTYSKETGFALCIAKKFLGNKGNFNEVFKKWIPEEVEEVREDAETDCVEILSYDGVKIGDKVKIVDNGQQYSTYEEWVEKNVASAEDRAKWYQGRDNHRCIRDHDIGVVKVIAPHERESDGMLALIERNNICYIVNFRGFKKVRVVYEV